MMENELAVSIAELVRESMTIRDVNAVGQDVRAYISTGELDERSVVLLREVFRKRIGELKKPLKPTGRGFSKQGVSAGVLPVDAVGPDEGPLPDGVRPLSVPQVLSSTDFRSLSGVGVEVTDETELQRLVVEFPAKPHYFFAHTPSGVLVYGWRFGFEIQRPRYVDVDCYSIPLRDLWDVLSLLAYSETEHDEIVSDSA